MTLIPARLSPREVHKSKVAADDDNHVHCYSGPEGLGAVMSFDRTRLPSTEYSPDATIRSACG